MTELDTALKKSGLVVQTPHWAPLSYPVVDMDFKDTAHVLDDDISKLSRIL